MGNTIISALSEHFTRWSGAIALSNGTVEIVADALEHRVFCYLGVLEYIHTDQGTQFESDVFATAHGLGSDQESQPSSVNLGGRERHQGTILLRGSNEWDIKFLQIMRTMLCHTVARVKPLISEF